MYFIFNIFFIISNAPYYLSQARKGYRMGNNVVVDGMIKDGLWDPYGDTHMVGGGGEERGGEGEEEKGGEGKGGVGNDYYE